MPEPYASHLADPHPAPDDYQPVPDIQPAGNGLLCTGARAARRHPPHLEAALDKSFRLLEEVGDFLGPQRQRLDALTVSFSTLCGRRTGRRPRFAARQVDGEGELRAQAPGEPS